MKPPRHLPSRNIRARLLRLLPVVTALLVLATACGGAGSSEDVSARARAIDPAQRAAAIEAAEANEGQLVLSDDVRTTQLLDTTDGGIRSLDDVVTGDRAVLLWYWAPHCPTCRRDAADVARFAVEHQDIIQVVGVGAQDDFAMGQDFLEDTGIADTEALTMLWEDTGRLWRLNEIRTNSSIQLYPHDLGQASDVMLYNESGLATVLDAAIQEPWAPADAPHLLGPGPGSDDVAPASASPDEENVID